MQDTLGSPDDTLNMAPASVLFGMMTDDFLESVVRQVLDCRKQLPPDVSATLNQAIDRHVNAQGFRYASQAPTMRILKQLCHCVRGSSQLALLALRAWGESQSQLRQSVTAQLEGLNIPVRNLDSLVEPLELVGNDSALSVALQRCLDCHADQDKDAVTLMVQLLTGKALVAGSEETENPIADFDGEMTVGRLLNDTLSALTNLPPTAAEWESLIPKFISSVSNLVETKGADREAAAALAEFLAEFESDYADLLEFFQCDASAWDLRNTAPGVSFQQIREQAEGLQGLLAQYVSIRAQAPVVAREIELMAQRAEMFPRITAAGEALQRMFAGSDATGAGDPQDSGDDDSEPVCKVDADGGSEYGAALGASSQATAADAANDGSNAAAESDQSAPADPEAGDWYDQHNPIPPCEIEDYLRRRLEFQELEQENEELEHANESLKQQVKALEQQLYESRHRGEGWRLALTYQENGEEADAVPELADVKAAVQLAEERFSEQLMFLFNAHSTVDTSAFKWPEQVWNALKWLATDYYDSHLGNNPIPDMDESCRLACKMWYKTSQHETTMMQYPDSYSTRVNGRRIWLREHIGKGNSFDPRRTIRIAFDWDRPTQKVIVGYIGQHQRTSAT